MQFDYPPEYVQAVDRLRAIHKEYSEAIKLDRPEAFLSDIMMRIGSELYFAQRWINHYRKVLAETTLKVQTEKAEMYKKVMKDENIAKSSRVEHCRWLFKVQDGELDSLSAIIDNMKTTYAYYNDLRTMIQSVMRQSNTERIMEGK